MLLRSRNIGEKSRNTLPEIIFGGLLFCVLFSVSVVGKSPTEYKNDVIAARQLTLKLLYPEGEVTDSAAKYEEFENETLKRILENVPPKVKIEWEGSSIETDNRWLGEKIDQYRSEAKNSEKREFILNEISERLDSIAKKAAEIENPPISQRTKDEDKRKLAEILRREEFKAPAEKEESLFQRILRKIKDWLNGFFPEREIQQTESSGIGQWARVLVYILFAIVIAALGFALYRFAPRFMKYVRARESTEKRERVILGETLGENQNSSDLLAEAELLARDGNLRGAIRKGYIALLCELSDRKVIGLSRHKTNRDYLRDLRVNTELYRDMNSLTFDFERHWYGFESADENDWELFKSGYKRALSKS